MSEKVEFSEHDMARIARMAANGVAQRDIAAVFGLSHSYFNARPEILKIISDARNNTTEQIAAKLIRDANDSLEHSHDARKFYLTKRAKWDGQISDNLTGYPVNGSIIERRADIAQRLVDGRISLACFDTMSNALAKEQSMETVERELERVLLLTKVLRADNVALREENEQLKKRAAVVIPYNV